MKLETIFPFLKLIGNHSVNQKQCEARTFSCEVLNLPDGTVMLVTHPITGSSTWFFISGETGSIESFNGQVIELEGKIVDTNGFLGTIEVCAVVSTAAL